LHARSGVLGRLADFSPPQVPKSGDWLRTNGVNVAQVF